MNSKNEVMWNNLHTPVKLPLKGRKWHFRDSRTQNFGWTQKLGMESTRVLRLFNAKCKANDSYLRLIFQLSLSSLATRAKSTLHECTGDWSTYASNIIHGQLKTKYWPRLWCLAFSKRYLKQQEHILTQNEWMYLLCWHINSD